MNPSIPLVVDLDGTLTPTDTLWETFWHLLQKNPLGALRCLPQLLNSRSLFKESVAEAASQGTHPWCAETLPWNPQVLEYIKKAKHGGRPVILATAAHQKIATLVSQKFPELFDYILASEGRKNLKGEEKVEAIKTLLKGGAYEYIGNEPADLPIWANAKAGSIVESPLYPNLKTQLTKTTPLSECFPPTACPLKSLLRGLRLKQWSKNLLVFAPMIAAHTYGDPSRWGLSVTAFLAFCLCASGAYLLNDLLDLPHDRKHTVKKKRPLAAGLVPIPLALTLAGALPLLGATLAWQINVLPLVTLYYVATVAYSTLLKKIALVDVTVLAGLYCLRIFTGGTATNDAVSLWMATFGGFLFLSLACLKRFSELLNVKATQKKIAHGRDYHIEDIPLLHTIGVSAGCIAPLVLTLYLQHNTKDQYYPHPEILWACACLIFLWIMNLWRDASHGSIEEEDPLSYSLSNKKSLWTLCLLGLSLFAATILP